MITVFVPSLSNAAMNINFRATIKPEIKMKRDQF